MKQEAIELFNKFTKKYDMTNEKNKWKYTHSYRVADVIVKIAIQEEFPKENMDFIYIIGLYHDLGRFPQIEEYNSYNDNKTIDHGNLGAKILKTTNMLKGLLTEEQETILELCLEYHNKYQTPTNYDETITKYINLIRDADKFDILKGIAEGNITRNQTSEAPTKSIIDDFYNQKVIKTLEVKNSSDSLINSFSFIYDLNYKTTKKMILDENIYPKLYNILDYKEYFKDILDYTIKYLKEGI